MDSTSEQGSGTDNMKRSSSTRESRGGSSVGGTNKVFPKLGKLGSSIQESVDTESKQTLQLESKELQLRKMDSYDGGLITQPSHDREILAAVLEVKVDLKLEVQRVNQRLAKIEDMLQTLVNRLATQHEQRSAPETPTNAASQQGLSSSQVPPFPSSSSFQQEAASGVAQLKSTSFIRTELVSSYTG